MPGEGGACRRWLRSCVANVLLNVFLICCQCVANVLLNVLLMCCQLKAEHADGSFMDN